MNTNTSSHHSNTSTSPKRLALKVDVDTDRGTRIGVANLLGLFAQLHISATFFFSLGPDNTGHTIKRIFRPGFLKKAYRSNVLGIYGLKTLLNGILWPGPHIGKRNQRIMYDTATAGHEVGIHCYDHIRWQDHLHDMLHEEIWAECIKAQQEFRRIFGYSAKTAGAAGWQANAFSLTVYDEMKLLYGSDTRGSYPFFPRIKNTTFRTLQIPTTLPTLDELIGRKEYPLENINQYYLSLLSSTHPNVLTIHAEIEGMKYLSWFESFLKQMLAEENIEIIPMEKIAQNYMNHSNPASSALVCELIQSPVDGRSGTLATQCIADHPK